MNLVDHHGEGSAFNLEHLALLASAAISEVDGTRRSDDNAIRSQQRSSFDHQC